MGRRKRPPESTLRTMLKWRTKQQIANHYDVTQKCVYDWIRYYNIPLESKPKKKPAFIQFSRTSFFP